MGLKEFFKINKLKIIILVILIVLTLITLIGRMTAPTCLTGPCSAGLIASISEPINKILTLPDQLMNKISLSGLVYKMNISVGVYKTLKIILFSLSLILDLIYQYIISCIIYFIIIKIKKL